MVHDLCSSSHLKNLLTSHLVAICIEYDNKTLSQQNLSIIKKNLKQKKKIQVVKKS